MFFIDLDSFVKGFHFVTLTYIHDDYLYSFYERLGSPGTDETFTFDLPSSAEAREFFVGLDFYPSRLYSVQCDKRASGNLELWQDGERLHKDHVDNMNGFGFLWVAPKEAKAGTYELKVKGLRFGKDVIPDYVVNVYGPA